MYVNVNSKQTSLLPFKRMTIEFRTTLRQLVPGRWHKTAQSQLGVVRRDSEPPAVASKGTSRSKKATVFGSAQVIDDLMRLERGEFL